MIRENPANKTQTRRREERTARERLGPHDRGLIDPEPAAHEPAMHEPVTRHETTIARETAVESERHTVHSASGLNIIAGLWLIIAPAALGYAAIQAALWNSVVIGVAVAAMAVVRVARPLEFEGVSWTNFVLGLWLVISPFAMGLWDVQAMVWNNIIVGLVILALAATSARATRMVREGAAGTEVGFARRSERGRSNRRTP